MTVESGHEPFEVEADVGIRAWGATRAEAFAQAALGVLALVVSADQVAEMETREVRAQGDSPESLLVNWINECLYVQEIEGFAVHRVQVIGCQPAFVHGVLHGEAIDPHRHRPGTIVKAATLHGVSVAQREGTHEVRVVVDV
jgi:tRNA nucleotidyltransferase (CCA-adding enzyme)